MRLPITDAVAHAARGSDGLSGPGRSPRSPAPNRSTPAGGYASSPPNRRRASSASLNRLPSGTPGPDPMTAISSPTTSEIASVWHPAADRRARPPPLMSERCFRTPLNAVMSAPVRNSRMVVAFLSSRETPDAGAAINADAPPERRQRKRSPGCTDSASASARRPARSLSTVGSGSPPAIISNGAATSSRSGLTTKPPTIRRPSTRAAPAAIAAAAFPAHTTRTLSRRPLPSSRSSARTTRPSGSTASIPARMMSSRSRRSLNGSAMAARSRLRRHGGEQRLDVPEREGEARHAVDALDPRDMIGHHHAVVADLLVDAHRLQHVHAAVVDERLAEVEDLSLDIAKVHVENLLARTEVADDVEDLLAGILELLRHGALAEIQAVVRARLDGHEALQPVR